MRSFMLSVTTTRWSGNYGANETLVMLHSHLNGTVLDSFARPSLLITDAYNANNIQPTRKQRDVELMGIGNKG